MTHVNICSYIFIHDPVYLDKCLAHSKYLLKVSGMNEWSLKTEQRPWSTGTEV